MLMKNSYPNISRKRVLEILSKEKSVVAVSISRYSGFGPDWLAKRRLADKHNVGKDKVFTSAGIVWGVGNRVQLWEDRYPRYRKSDWDDQRTHRLFLFDNERVVGDVKSFCTKNFLERTDIDLKKYLKHFFIAGSFGLIPWDRARVRLASETVVEAIPSLFNLSKKTKHDPMDIGNVLSEFTTDIYDI